MIPKILPLAFVGEPFAVTLSKVLAIIRAKVIADVHSFDYRREACIEDEATDKNPLIENRVSTHAIQAIS